MSLISPTSLLGSHSDLSTYGDQAFSRDWGSHMRSGEPSEASSSWPNWSSTMLSYWLLHLSRPHQFPSSLWMPVCDDKPDRPTAKEEGCKVQQRAAACQPCPLSSCHTLGCWGPPMVKSGALAKVNLRCVGGIGSPGSTRSNGPQMLHVVSICGRIFFQFLL